MTIRGYQPDDAAAVARIFTESVRSTAARDYSPEQIDAWAPDPPEVRDWHRRLDGVITFIAEQGSEVAGFITFEPDGRLAYLYVGHRFQRQGMARALCGRVEEEARARGVGRIFAEASITARPFFESAGFRAITEQWVDFRGVSFKNYRMEKFLSKPSES